jgi:hypothetical protein
VGLRSDRAGADAGRVGVGIRGARAGRGGVGHGVYAASSHDAFVDIGLGDERSRNDVVGKFVHGCRGTTALAVLMGYAPPHTRGLDVVMDDPRAAESVMAVRLRDAKHGSGDVGIVVDGTESPNTRLDVLVDYARTQQKLMGVAFRGDGASAGNVEIQLRCGDPVHADRAWCAASAGGRLGGGSHDEANGCDSCHAAVCIDGPHEHADRCGSAPHSAAGGVA